MRNARALVIVAAVIAVSVAAVVSSRGGVIRGEIVRMTVAEDATVQDNLADQVRDLRERVSTVAEELSEATSQLDPAATT